MKERRTVNTTKNIKKVNQNKNPSQSSSFCFLLLTNLLDLKQRERLAMTDIAAIANLGLEFDNRDFVCLTVFKYLGGDLHTGDKGRANLDFRAIRFGYEHGFKRHRLTRFEIQFFNLDFLALLDEVLLTASGNNCVHKLLAAQAPLTLALPLPKGEIKRGFRGLTHAFHE